MIAYHHHYQTDEGYSYDSNGNRTNTGYDTGGYNRLTSDGTFDYTYDDEGNRGTRTRISQDPADDYLTEYEWKGSRDRGQTWNMHFTVPSACVCPSIR